MARTLGPLLAAFLLLCPVSLPGQEAQPRLLRDQLPQPQTQALTFEGAWGFPCARDYFCGTPATQWVPLEVAAWVGDEKFVGEASTPYMIYDFEVTVQVPPSRRGDLVMLEVLAQAPEGHTARFQSLQGMAGELLAEAGPGGRLGYAAHRTTRMSVLTTALVGLLQEANGGDWRMERTRLLELVRRVDPEQLVRHGQVFGGIVRGWLPGAGELDPNALILSSQAVEAYLAGVADPTLQLSHDDYQPPSQEAWDRTLVAGAPPGTVPFGRREGVRLRMNDAWATGVWSGSIMDTGRSVDVGGFVGIGTDHHRPFQGRVVRPGEPSRVEQRIRFDCPGVGEVDALRVTGRRPLGYSMLAMVGGVEFGLYGDWHQHHYRLPGGIDPSCLDAVPEPPPRLLYYVAHRPQGFARARLAAMRQGGVLALQWPNPDADYENAVTQFTAGTIDLANATVTAPGYAADAVVDVSPDGMLMVTVDTLPGSVLDGQVELRMERVRSDGLGAEEWMLSTRVSGTVDDHIRAYATPVVGVDTRLALQPDALEGTWRSGVELSRFGTVEASTVDIDAISGQGVAQAPGGEPVPFSWRLDEGSVVASTFVLDSEPDELRAVCPPGALDCREVLRRVWEPLRMSTRSSGRRLYVIEDSWRDDGDGLWREVRQLNFYDAP